jgi:hypothetical protein
MDFQSVTVVARIDNTAKYLFFAAAIGMIIGLLLLRRKMTHKLVWSIAIGVIGSAVFFWVPTFLLGSFDEHMTMYYLLLFYCPLIICPLICFGAWSLRPSTTQQRLWIPFAVATSLMLPSIAALTWREHDVHYVRGSEIVYTFCFLIGWLYTEVLALSLPLSFAVSAIQDRRNKPKSIG